MTSARPSRHQAEFRNRARRLRPRAAYRGVGAHHSRRVWAIRRPHSSFNCHPNCHRAVSSYIILSQPESGPPFSALSAGNPERFSGFAGRSDPDGIPVADPFAKTVPRRGRPKVGVMVAVCVATIPRPWASRRASPSAPENGHHPRGRSARRFRSSRFRSDDRDNRQGMGRRARTGARAGRPGERRFGNHTQ